MIFGKRAGRLLLPGWSVVRVQRLNVLFPASIVHLANTRRCTGKHFPKPYFKVRTRDPDILNTLCMRIRVIFLISKIVCNLELFSSNELLTDFIALIVQEKS